MGTSYIKPGIDRTSVNGPMFTHYNIVPVYGEEEVDDEVDATPDIDEQQKGNTGSGIIDETKEGEGETIIEPPKIENSENGNNGTNSQGSGGSTNTTNPNDNGTIDNNTTGENEEAVTPGGVTIE